jgi:hypothetical protein
MSNEKRGNPRTPIELDAVLNYEAFALICTIRDISLNGAFVEAAPEELPFNNTSIELSLTVTNGGEPQYFRIPARIRRVTDHGAGVSFGDVGMDAYFSLVNMVYHA